MARTAKKKTAKRKTTTRKTTAKRTTAKRKPAKKAATRRTTTAKRKTAKRTTKRATATRGRKTTAKRATTARKSTASTSTVLKPMPSSPVKEVHNKSQVMTYISEHTELSRKQVANVFEALSNLASRHLAKRGPGEFTIPGLMKCVVKRKPATKARRGINPFTGEETTFKAKPARNVVKVRPLKRLKEMAE